MPVELDSDVLARTVTSRSRVSQHKLRSALRTLRSVWRLGNGLVAARRHRALTKVLDHPDTAAFGQRHPKVRYKYLFNYAAKNLTTKQRHALLAGHYRTVQAQLSARQLTAILDNRLPIWRGSAPDTPLSIHLGFPAAVQTEGDLCVTMKIGQLEMYRIVFILAGGALFGLEARPVIFITCIQGLASQLHMRAAKDVCCDVHPADMLMAALDGVARVLGVVTIAGIATANQVAHKHGFKFSYEAFFEQYGARAHGASQTMLIAAPLTHKQIALVASKRRKRSTAKREFRDAVGASAAAALLAAA